MRYNRLRNMVGFAVTAWEMLPEDCKELYFCDTGTYGFLEDVVAMHHERLTDDEWETFIKLFEDKEV